MSVSGINFCVEGVTLSTALKFQSKFFTGVVSSVGWFLPTGQIVTVDIDGWCGSTYGRTQSISTVGSISPTKKYDRYWWSVRSIVPKNRSISTIQVNSYKIGRPSISTVEVDKQSKKCWHWVCVHILHNTNRSKWLIRTRLLFTVTNIKFLSLNNTHTDRDHDGTETRVNKVGFDCGKSFSYLLSECSITPTPTPTLASQQCKKNSTVQRLVPVITLVATASKWFCRLHVTCSCCSWPRLELPYINTKLGTNGSNQYRSWKTTIGLLSQKWWRMIPDNHPPRSPTGGEEWSQHICKYRHQSTNFPTGRSVTVDIDGQFDSIYVRTRSISIVGSIPPTENYGPSLIVDKWSR